MLAPQVLICPKSPATKKPQTLTGTLPVLVMVEESAALVEPTS